MSYIFFQSKTTRRCTYTYRHIRRIPILLLLLLLLLLVLLMMVMLVMTTMYKIAEPSLALHFELSPQLSVGMNTSQVLAV